jgi:hypothetical protein
MEVETNPGEAKSVSERRLWFGFGAGAVSWALHGLISFLICTQACQDGAGDLGPLPAGSVRILLGVITLFFLAVTTAGGIVSFRLWRVLAERRDLMHAEGRGRQEYMALLGVFVSTVFVLGIIWAGLPPIFINVCVTPR